MLITLRRYAMPAILFDIARRRYMPLARCYVADDAVC